MLPPLKGSIPQVGQLAPALRFVKQDRSNAELASLKGQVVILLMFPSLDTNTCAIETRTFNKLAADLGFHVLVITVDTPFAMKRFCVAEGIENVETGSDFRFHDAFENWGAGITAGPLEGALARVVWVIDREGIIRYVEVVPELGREPDYDAALTAAKGLV